MSTPEGLCTKCSATQYCAEHEPAPAPVEPCVVCGASDAPMEPDTNVCAACWASAGTEPGAPAPAQGEPPKRSCELCAILAKDVDRLSAENARLREQLDARTSQIAEWALVFGHIGKALGHPDGEAPVGVIAAGVDAALARATAAEAERDEARKDAASCNVQFAELAARLATQCADAEDARAALADAQRVAFMAGRRAERIPGPKGTSPRWSFTEWDYSSAQVRAIADADDAEAFAAWQAPQPAPRGGQETETP